MLFPLIRSICGYADFAVKDVAFFQSIFKAFIILVAVKPRIRGTTKHRFFAVLIRGNIFLLISVVLVYLIMDNPITRRFMAIAGAFLSWIAVVLQFILMFESREFSVPETIVRFFSYYTILTNLLMACCFTALVLKRGGARPTFFTDPRLLTATAVYITIVGAVYNIILRQLWTPEGLQLFVDELLHSVNPVYYLVFWVSFVPKSGLKWTHVFPWLVYPLVYFVCILVRGNFSGFYPYPFIDVLELGWNKVLTNSAGITAAFVLLSLIIIAVSKAMVSKDRK